MGEYAAFHYLNHKDVDPVKAVYLEAPKPLTFAELYSPRDTPRVQIYKGEKSYWRTRDRIEYCMYEERGRKVPLLVVTCRNIEQKQDLRTIFLSLEKLYFEVEAKAQESRDPLVKKKDKKVDSDKALHKAAADFVLARLNIKADPMPWPTSFDPPAADAAAAVVDPLAAASSSAAPSAPVGERMCTFDKLSSDAFEALEVPCPDGWEAGDMPCTKLKPTPPPEPEPSPAPAPAEGEGAAAAEGAGEGAGAGKSAEGADDQAAAAAAAAAAAVATTDAAAAAPAAATAAKPAAAVKGGKAAPAPAAAPAGKKVAPAPAPAAAAAKGGKTPAAGAKGNNKKVVPI